MNRNWNSVDLRYDGLYVVLVLPWPVIACFVIKDDNIMEIQSTCSFIKTKKKLHLLKITL